MTPDPLLYGDVFLYGGIEFIFLAATERNWYAARIISRRDTLVLTKFYERAVAKNKTRIETLPLYCFVELQTPGYQGRAAHLKDSQKDTFSETPKPIKVELSDGDKKAIARLILTEKSPVSLELKQLIKKLDIDL